MIAVIPERLSWRIESYSRASEFKLGKGEVMMFLQNAVAPVSVDKPKRAEHNKNIMHGHCFQNRATLMVRYRVQRFRVFGVAHLQLIAEITPQYRNSMAPTRA